MFHNLSVNCRVFSTQRTLVSGKNYKILRKVLPGVVNDTANESNTRKPWVKPIAKYEIATPYCFDFAKQDGGARNNGENGFPPARE